MRFSKFIFDFDGTLVDSMPTWTEKMLRILKREGVEYSSELVNTITPLGDKGTAIYFKNVLGVKSSVEDMLSQMDSYAHPKYENTIILKPGIMEYLKLLKKHKHSLCVLTASPHGVVELCLERNGVIDLFDHIWCCDDFGKAKNDPRIYSEVTLELGVEPSETVLFDDNINAIRAASESGVYTVGVYDESSKLLKSKIAEMADMYIDSFDDLSISKLV